MKEINDNSDMDKNDEKYLEREIHILSQELYDMRSDERECQNQILQVLSVAAAVLSVFFGGGFLFGSKTEEETQLFHGNLENPLFRELSNYISRPRVAFLCICIVFIVAITYGLKLCIANTLRYFHIKDLQNRLIELRQKLNGSREQGGKELLYWDEFRMVIMTMNPKNLSSFYALSHFIVYTIAIICILVFCLVITIIQFFMIENRQWYDNAGLIIVLSIVIFCISIFIYTATNSSKFVKWIHEYAIGRRTDKDTNQSDLLHNIVYMIYPRYQDFGKLLLVLLGMAISYIHGQKNIASGEFEIIIRKSILTVLVFDVCMYRARFLINDLRGWKEDKQSERNDRIRSNDNNEKKYIRAVLSCIILRVITGLLILHIFDNTYLPVIGTEVALLIIITILYEAARSFESNKDIIFAVGLGYPLRISVGVLSAYPEIQIQKYYDIRTIILILLSIYFWGVFASLLSWAQDTVSIFEKYRKSPSNNLFKFEKSYHSYLFQALKKPYKKILSQTPLVSKTIYPLREKGRITDLWNVTFILSILCASASCLLLVPGNSILRISTEGFVVFLTLFICMELEQKSIEKGCWIEICVLILKIIALLWQSPQNGIQLIIITVVQIMIVYTYYLLRYSPEIQLQIIFRKIIIGTLNFILTKTTAEILLRPDDDGSGT